MLLTNGRPTLDRVNNKAQVLPRVELAPGPNIRAGHFRGESDPQDICTHNRTCPNIEYPFRAEFVHDQYRGHIKLDQPAGVRSYFLTAPRYRYCLSCGLSTVADYKALCVQPRPSLIQGMEAIRM